MNTQPIPDGFLKDAQNRLVPIDTIEPIDLERNDLVIGLVEKAKRIKKLLTEFKLESFGDIAALQEMSAEQYGIKMGGKKGNISLPSFDGRYKIQRSIADNVSFDERLQVAKELIDQCIHRWSDGVDSKVRALVEHAFQVDKEGKINTGRVLTLRRIKIDDEQWQQAMDAIADSIQVSGSTTYLRLYERVGETDQFESISLDLAKV
jgi:hypothetical protein